MRLAGCKGIRKALGSSEVFWCDHMVHSYIISMEALVADLERAHIEHLELFSQFSVANLAVEMVQACLVLISLLEHCILIARFFTIHTDLKPQNFGGYIPFQNLYCTSWM